jgi:murein DD-endopeptidase MepM/ murein hydrolase activator NlpD
VNRKFMLLLSMILVIVLVAQPYNGQALSEVEKIDKELKQLKNEMEQAAKSQKSAASTVKILAGEKETTKADIEALLSRIGEVQKKIEATQAQIAVAEEELYVTGAELEDSIKQLKNREELMDSRVRLAYTSGTVSYLDVLLGSSSISDFLDRLDTVESIVTQDRNIAVQKKEYSQEVADKKAKVESELAAVQALYVDMEARKSELEKNEQEKEVMMSKISKEIEEMEEISEESEKALTELAKKASALEAKKNQIKNYYKGGKLGMPLKADYRLSSPFGYRTHPITGKKTLHAGMDMAAPSGTSVYAAETGVVIVAQSWSGYGNCIIIDHGGGLWTLYGHLKNGGILVKKGETVKRGAKIGLVGSTGQSTGNHLHFEVRKNSEPVNPATYLK